MDFYSSTTQQDNSFNYNSPTVCTDKAGPSSVDVFYVLTCVIISIGLPLTLLAIYALFSLIRKDHVAPIYVINLLISDLIQLCCMIPEVVKYMKFFEVFAYMHLIGLMASVCFMVCIALERYLVVAWPLWYRHRRTIKVSLVVCVVVWTIPLAYILPGFFWNDGRAANTFFGIFLLLPYPLLVFFLVGTIKALSAAISVPPDEKRRIVALLVLVLLIYTLIFLPNAIWSLIENAQHDYYFTSLSFYILKFSPLADLFLYVFLRKGAVDKLLASLCCCSKDRNDLSRSTLSTV